MKFEQPRPPQEPDDLEKAMLARVVSRDPKGYDEYTTGVPLDDVHGRGGQSAQDISVRFREDQRRTKPKPEETFVDPFADIASKGFSDLNIPGTRPNRTKRTEKPTDPFDDLDAAVGNELQKTVK